MGEEIELVRYSLPLLSFGNKPHTYVRVTAMSGMMAHGGEQK
jgi:hypothetical protein